MLPSQQQQPASRPLSDKSNSHNYILYLTLAIVGFLLLIWIYLLLSDKPKSKRITKQIKDSQASDDEGSEYEYVEVTDDEANEANEADEADETDEVEDAQESKLSTVTTRITKKIADEVDELEAENSELQAKA